MVRAETAISVILLASLVSANYHDPKTADGRSSIVHLFEWRWADIAEECEVFLGPYGYGGVQVSPPNENGIVWAPDWKLEVKRPWFERYQPVSYKLNFTRSGGENEFRDMVRRCNDVGVRIYVDAVINHMTGNIGAGHGTGGSYFDPVALKYDGVPYSHWDFNTNEKCGTPSGNIENYNDAYQVRNCRLSGLNDLDLGKDYVREKIIQYLNYLIDIGVAGFRVDAAKHMWPEDLKALFENLHDLSAKWFEPGTRPFIFMEVIDLGGQAIGVREYIHLGRVTEFRYGYKLGNVIRKNGGEQMQYLRSFGQGWGFVHEYDALVFVDNHDNQRGHGAGGLDVILTHFESRMYKMATAFMLAWPYGFPRIMSSYSWPRHIEFGKDKNDWIGPPHDDDYNTLHVIRNSDLTCGNGWVCEHRWRQIYNMVKFRNVAGATQIGNWWDNGGNQIAFSRGNRGFIAINNENFSLNKSLQTGLEAGRYCDVISGKKKDDTCTGRIIEVGELGYSHIFIDNKWEDPVLAIHLEAKL
ncbi:pancreatic alpha-amylase 2a5-like [Tachypleus tridentatus]|uniref:pancreatic alpha-amylase 2a5-like n=1 Tax=Tachypleus tridentatus TaxID=6853 RepID=UPI003FD2F626